MALSKQEVLDIIDTYDGMLRLKWDAQLLARRTYWCGVLATL